MSALDHIDSLQQHVEQFAVDHHCPSIAWGLVLDGTLAHAGSVGGTGSDTVYRIASMTKSFTAAVALALRDDGVLSLDDPIAHHAPELTSIVGPTGDDVPIRICHLLSMASGLATDDAWADRHLDITDDHLDAVVASGLLFAWPTGTQFEYSNLGYALLGRVILHATGTTVQEHVQRQLIEPLGLTRTGWLQPEHDDWARPFRIDGDGATADPVAPLGDGALGPMGGLWSTVGDVARWMAWLDGGPVHGPLSRASRFEMHQMHCYSGLREQGGRMAPAGYGYGLNIRDDARLGLVVTHSGGLPGYGSNMRWLAGRRIGIVALANVTYAPMTDLTLAMLDCLADHDALTTAQIEAPLANELGHRLIALLANWDDDTADALFTDNVALDESYASRRARAARLIDECGGQLVVQLLEPDSATSAVITVAAPSGACARIDFQSAPMHPPRIQFYDIETAD